MAITEVSIRLVLPKELKNKLDRAAKKRRIPRLGLIRLALSDWLEAESRTGQGKERSHIKAK